jgi:predicted membrane protein
MAEYDPNERLEDRIRRDIHERVSSRIWERHQAREQRRQERWERRREGWDRRHYGSGGLIAGAILAVIGVLLLLQNLGILIVDDLWEYWPVLLIVFGASRAVMSLGLGGKIWGGAIAFAGGLLLLHNLDIIRVDMWHFFWPVMLIGIGVAMLARNLERSSFWHRGTFEGTSPASGAAPSAANWASPWAFFSGVKRRIESQDFEGCEALAVFGGAMLDLREANTKKDEIVIEANALCGGIDIRVPETWNVSVRGTAIFGGYEDKTKNIPSTEAARRPLLIVTGFVVFGGVTIKH